MKHCQRNLILVFVLTIILGAIGSQTKMIYTYSLMRHGAKYPSNDLYNGGESQELKGQLTPIGLRQHYNLGTYLKQNYITEEKITTPTFNPV